MYVVVVVVEVVARASSIPVVVKVLDVLYLGNVTSRHLVSESIYFLGFFGILVFLGVKMSLYIEISLKFQY